MVGAMVGITNARCEARFRTAHYRKCTYGSFRRRKIDLETFVFATEGQRGGVFHGHNHSASMFLCGQSAQRQGSFRSQKKPESFDSGFVIDLRLLILSHFSGGFLFLLFAASIAQSLRNRVFLLLEGTT